MLKIKFERPFSVYIEVVETSDYLPSLRIEAKIVISQFQHMFSYQGTFWLECECWTNFTNSLNDPSRDAVLNDMGNNFALAIYKNDGKKIMSWKLNMTDVSGSSKTTVAFSAEIDDDMLGAIKREFEEFPVWW